MKLRRLVGLSCVAVFAGFALHSSRMAPMKVKEAWKIGYWVWAGEPPVTAGFEPEILYVDARQPLARQSSGSRRVRYRATDRVVVGVERRNGVSTGRGL